MHQLAEGQSGLVHYGASVFWRRQWLAHHGGGGGLEDGVVDAGLLEMLQSESPDVLSGDPLG